MITDSKLMHHLDRLYGNKEPVTADVFITNYCNAQCPFCTYNRWNLKDKAIYTPLEDFKQYAFKLRELGVKGIILTGGGEPTIHPQFNQICEFLESQNFAYGINTNFIQLKYIKPDYLKISLDGFDKISYNNIKGVDKYQQVRQNIIKYAEFKEKNSPKTNLGIQKIVTEPQDILEFYNANKDLPVDYIVFRPIESTLGQYYKQIYRYPKESLKIIERIQKKINELQLIINGKKQINNLIFVKLIGRNQH